jgi:hypothetical protein
MTSSPALITRDYNGHTFTFRPDGWFNMTKAAAHFGKKLSNFWASPGTEEYLAALAELPEFQGVKLVAPTPGHYGGTWGHPTFAVPFARWLDVRFAVWFDAMIENIIKGAAELVITKPAESAGRLRCTSGRGSRPHGCDSPTPLR